MSNAERNEEIIRRRLSGELPSDIRRAMGISRNVVAGVLNRAEIVLGGHRDGCLKHTPRGEEHCNAKLTDREARIIRSEYCAGKPWHAGNVADLAERFGVTPYQVQSIANGRAWKHVA